MLVRSVHAMDDETLMKHLENRHEDDLRISFKPEPGKSDRTLAAPQEWRTYHDTMHRLYPRKYEHEHPEVVRG